MEAYRSPTQPENLTNNQWEPISGELGFQPLLVYKRILHETIPGPETRVERNCMGTIDFTVVCDYMIHKSPSERTKWFKYMHNQQSTGTKKQMMTGTNSGIRIDMCPCCHGQPESQRHIMILCDANPNRREALAELDKGGSKSRDHHRFTTIFTDCVVQWLRDPTHTPSSSSTASVVLSLHREIIQPHMVLILNSAIQEQTAIGWLNLFRGYLSKQWTVLASSHMINPLSTPQPCECKRGRCIGTVLQRIQAFLSSTWTGRNEALHRNDHDDEKQYQSLGQPKSDTTSRSRIY